MHLHRHASHEHRWTLERLQRLIILVSTLNLLGHIAVDAPINRGYHVTNYVWSHSLCYFIFANHISFSRRAVNVELKRAAAREYFMP